MRRKTATGLTAKNADRHQLYETAVQQPEVMIGFVEELFEHLELPEPQVMREDFCGTAQLAALWAASDDARQAVGVDNDPQIIEYAERQHRAPLGDGAERLELICDDVMSVDTPAEALLSLNFSHFIYKSRDVLLAYLKHARQCIKPGGLMILDAFGGPGSLCACRDERNFSRFDYIWEQEDYNPLTHEITCRIHFRFRNGTMLRDAFVYHWRMWSLPELTELLAEAGFAQTGVYFESEDGFVGDVDEVDTEAWVAYVVAMRGSD